MYMSKGRSLAAGLIVGGVIGGVAALLTAPTSGKHLRGQLKANCGKWEDTVKRLKNDGIALKEQFVKTAIEGAEIIKDVGSELQTSIQEWREEIKPHQQDLKKEIAEIEEKIKQLEKTLQN